MNDTIDLFNEVFNALNDAYNSPNNSAIQNKRFEAFEILKIKLFKKLFESKYISDEDVLNSIDEFTILVNNLLNTTFTNDDLKSIIKCMIFFKHKNGNITIKDILDFRIQIQI